MSGSQPKRIACIVTEYRENTHADVIVGKILDGYDQQGGSRPHLHVASLFADQMPQGDLSRSLSELHKFPIVETIEHALTLGTNDIAVDGVLIIGEHGRYPHNVKKQHCYPRERLFEDVVAVFEKYDSIKPIFSDKHLSYNWHNAEWIYQTARAMNIPFMAGSSLPVTYRRPSLVIPMGSLIDEALAIGYGGLDSYGFHAVETLQCMVERRRGGETGVERVQCLRGQAMIESLRDGLWSQHLLESCLAHLDSRPGSIEKNCGERDDAAVFLIQYSDGLKASVAMLNGHCHQFGFASSLQGSTRPDACEFYLVDAKPYPHFAFLLKAIEQLMLTERPAYPVERTLMTTGILDAAITSNFQNGRVQHTPHLASLAYSPVDYPFAPNPDLGIDSLRDHARDK